MKKNYERFHKYYKGLLILCIYLCACLVFFIVFIKHQIEESMIHRISQLLKAQTVTIAHLPHPWDEGSVSDWSSYLFDDLYDGSGQVYILRSNGNIHYAGPGMDHTVGMNFGLFLEADTPVCSCKLRHFTEDLQQNISNGMIVRYQDDFYYMCYAPLMSTGLHLVYLVPTSYAQKEYSFVRQGSLLYLALSAVGVLVFMWITLLDIRRENRCLTWQAERDSLTGLLNQRALKEGITHILQSGTQDSHHLFCLIDLDGFKRVNDTLGHDAGDNLLREVATCLTEVCRSSDIVGRSGGDEFIIFFKDVKDSPLPLDQITSLNQRIQELPLLADSEVKIGCSIGLATYPTDGRDFLSLYKNSDHALYTSKKMGKGMVTRFSDLKPGN